MSQGPCLKTKPRRACEDMRRAQKLKAVVGDERIRKHDFEGKGFHTIDTCNTMVIAKVCN